MQFAFAVPCFSSQRLGTSRWRRFSVATGSCHCSCMMVVLKRILWPSQRDLMTLMTLSTSRLSHVGPLPKLRDAEDLEEKIRNQIICHQMSINSSIFIMSISLFVSIEKFHLLLLRVFFLCLCISSWFFIRLHSTQQLDNSTTRLIWRLWQLPPGVKAWWLVENIRWESQLQGRTRRANLVAWNFWTFQKSMCLSHLEHQPESSGTWVLNIKDDATFTHVSQQDSRNTCVFCFVTPQLKFEVHIGCFSSRLRFDPHSFLCTQERSKSCA